MVHRYIVDIDIDKLIATNKKYFNDNKFIDSYKMGMLSVIEDYIYLFCEHEFDSSNVCTICGLKKNSDIDISKSLLGIINITKY